MRALVTAVVVVLAGCAQAPEPCLECTFAPGEAGDPIVKAARDALTGTETVTLTLTNKTSYRFVEGLITLTPLFTVGTAPSTALFSYVHSGTAATGKASQLASALGLAVGTTAFVVPKIDKGTTVSVTLTVPAGTKISWVARVDTSLDDFVSVVDVALSSGWPGAPVPVAMSGYDLSSTNNPGGITTLGNGTVGASLASSTITVTNGADCPGGAQLTRVTLVNDDFSTGANTSAWPLNAGWHGDFNGDWYTDGFTARVWNPNWGGAAPGAPIPTTTGFWKFVDVCPASGSMLNLEAKVVTQFSDPLTDTTLVAYFFDRGGALLGVSTNSPLHDQNDRRFAIYDAAIPSGTRRIAIAPMMYLAAKETGAAYYDSLRADYEPATAFTTTVVATDDFSSWGASTYGNNQPTGWAEFGGDWYAITSAKWATVWNPAFSGGAANIDTGLVKAFALGSVRAGEVISAKIFAAATFTDKTSFARLRLVFNDAAATTLESDRQVRGYGDITLRRAVIPTGATSVTVIVNAYLGAAEKSSLYVDTFKLQTQRAN